MVLPICVCHDCSDTRLRQVTFLLESLTYCSHKSLYKSHNIDYQKLSEDHFIEFTYEPQGLWEGGYLCSIKGWLEVRFGSLIS